MEIKKHLGIGRFASNDFFTSEKSEIDFSAYTSTTTDDSKCLNETEVIHLTTKMDNMTASTSATSAMGHVPFRLTREAEKEVGKFSEGGKVKFVSLSLCGSKGEICLTPNVNGASYV